MLGLSSPGVAAQQAYTKDRIQHWDAVAERNPKPPFLARYYQRKLRDIYRFLVAPGQRVLEIGCGRGDLLASLEPSVGLGVDFSGAMVRQATARHPDLHFWEADAHDLPFGATFDVIILSDLVNDLWDVQAVLSQAQRLATARTRVILNFYSRLWQVPLALARWLGWATPLRGQNWLTREDVYNLLDLADFQVIRQWGEILWPLRTPPLDRIANRYLVKTWPFCYGALANFIVARLQPHRQLRTEQPRVSVIIPTRNEAGNISEIFGRLPDMGSQTELVFVEGHSQDDTYAAIEREIQAHPERCCKLLRQTGVGKGDAVRLALAEAAGEMLMILDADLTVAPEDLPRFYEALYSGKGDFINGVRLVYPMEQQAMRFLNLLGNKFFSLAFTWLLGQPIKDTLCGTKVFWKSDYELIAANRAYFGDFDPFGDFDLLFGSAKQNLKLVDLPIRYRERTYGTTSIQRWKHGWLLLQMAFFAARKIKFFWH
jgi:SAM-dependent methyltransferase